MTKYLRLRAGTVDGSGSPRITEMRLDWKLPTACPPPLSSSQLSSALRLAQVDHNLLSLSISANIDTSSPPQPRRPFLSSSDESPSRNPDTLSSTHSTPRPVSRASNISRQIYQFALGFPAPVSPDPSPELGYSQLVGETNGDPFGDDMAQSFLFKWYVLVPRA